MNPPTTDAPWYRYWERSTSTPEPADHGAPERRGAPRAADSARGGSGHGDGAHDITARPAHDDSAQEDDAVPDDPREDSAPVPSSAESSASGGLVPAAFHVKHEPDPLAPARGAGFHVKPPTEEPPAPQPLPAPPPADRFSPSSAPARAPAEPSGRQTPETGAPQGPGFDRARVLTIANQKGGVGKTTTAVSVSAALADLGCRVLLVDLDPQGNATSGVGVRVPPNRPTIYDVLVGGVDIEDAIEPTSVRNLFVVPSNLDLAGAEIELVSVFNREQRLRRALESVRSQYDVVLIDCPPSLGLLTVNALSAGDGLIVPIQCEYYALEGLGALRRNADLIQSQLNPDLDITGFVLTMLDARTRLSQQVVDEVRAHFGDRVFTTRIPRSVRLAEAPGFGQPITVFDPSSRGAMAYRRLAAELLDRLLTNDGRPPPDRRSEGAPV